MGIKMILTLTLLAPLLSVVTSSHDETLPSRPQYLHLTRTLGHKVPPTTIKITKTVGVPYPVPHPVRHDVVVRIPKPYPVPVPVPQPVPVYVETPAAVSHEAPSGGGEAAGGSGGYSGGYGAAPSGAAELGGHSGGFASSGAYSGIPSGYSAVSGGSSGGYGAPEASSGATGYSGGVGGYSGGAGGYSGGAGGYSGGTVGFAAPSAHGGFVQAGHPGLTQAVFGGQGFAQGHQGQGEHFIMIPVAVQHQPQDEGGNHPSSENAIGAINAGYSNHQEESSGNQGDGGDYSGGNHAESNEYSGGNQDDSGSYGEGDNSGAFATSAGDAYRKSGAKMPTGDDYGNTAAASDDSGSEAAKENADVAEYNGHAGEQNREKTIVTVEKAIDMGSYSYFGGNALH